MLYCLNPDCPKALNPDTNRFCQTCQTPLIRLLRGRYRITRLLSDEGGFGRTYIAEDVDKLNERCVVKQLVPQVQGTWAHNQAVKLFEQEAKRLQELGEHPQIPTLLAYFEHDNYLYLVQQFIDGKNLLEELKQRRNYTDSQIREVLQDLLPVLKFIHKNGVIHRDIKPQNIMRRQSDGKLVLIDFGASKQLTATVRMKPGTTIGTYGYSPIEQMKQGEAYPASDLFSLGATCFHLLTRVDPCDLWAEHGYSWVNSWRQFLKSGITNELADILDKLLKKDVHLRYKSVDDVIKDLSNQPLSPSKVTRQPLLRRSKPTLQLPVKAKATLPLPSPIEIAKFTGKIFANSTSMLWRVTCTSFPRLLLLVLLGLTGTQIYGYIFHGRFPSHPLPVITTLPNITLPQKILGVKDIVNIFFVKVVFVTLRPDGKTILSVGSNNNVILWDVENEQKIYSLKGKKVFAFSPDSKTLATATEDSKIIKLWNLATKQQSHNLIGHLGKVDFLAFSPDGKNLTSSSHETGYYGFNEIKLWNLATERENRTLKYTTSSIAGDDFHALSPDGQTVASVHYIDDGNYLTKLPDVEIKVWNIVTGQEIRTLKLNSYVNSVIFNSTGKAIAAISNSYRYDRSEGRIITVWDLATGEKIRTIEPSFPVQSPKLSPDGKNFIIRHEKAVILWHLPTGQETRIPGGSLIRDSSSNLHSFLGEYDFSGLSPDGKTLANISENTIRLWNLATGQEIHILQGNAVSASTVAFSPDSKILATASNETIMLWDVATGETVRTIRQDSVGIFCLAFSPDGKTLVSGGSNGTIRFWEVSK